MVRSPIPWSILLSLLVVVLGGLGALIALPGPIGHKVEVLRDLPDRVLTRFLPPRGGTRAQMAPLEVEAVRNLSKRLDAEIVWSSNRGGNHDLYLLDLKSRRLRRLTDDPHVDTHPRFSPDGKRIVFMRSQQQWVSLRDEKAWDLFVIDEDGSRQRLLTRNGYAPYWTPDGRSVVFSRGNQVVRFSLETNEEEIVLDGDQEIRGAHIAGGNPSPDGRLLAFSIRGVFDGVAIYDLSQHRLIPVGKDACQIVWAPDGSLIWVTVGGEGGTQIMRMSQGRTAVFMDLPGAFSHEYFPRVSNDGHWLVWGASAGGHEHDRADYEIFVWQVGTPWDQAVRLTYDPNNDNWPDIHVNR